MRSYLDKERVIPELMKIGYTREEAFLVADVSDNAVSQCMEKAENATRSLPENMRAQAYVIIMRTMQALGDRMCEAVATMHVEAGAKVIRDEVPRNG